MCFERFESNRAKYGQCSSWAVWNQGACEYLGFEPDAGAAPGFFVNTSVRKLNAICSQRDLDGLGWRLNPNVVLVALNFAERDERTKAATAGIDYHAFHEETSLTSDQRLRDACCGTGLWGGYLTDLVKFDGDELTPFRSSKADPIIHRLRDPAFRQMQVTGLIKELEALDSRSPVVVALGNDVFQCLEPCLIRTGHFRSSWWRHANSQGHALFESRRHPSQRLRSRCSEATPRQPRLKSFLSPAGWLATYPACHP